MYTDFYGLKELPFKLTPDPRFLYFSAGHKEALAQMAFGINMRLGFVAIIGEVGTGKTMLIHALLKQLDPTTKTAYIFHALLGGKGLFQSICREFGIPFTGRETKNELIFQLHDYLTLIHQSGGNAVLIVDEAQKLKPHIMEEIRLFSNLETDSSKLIQVLLVGQPEFGRLLDRQDMRQLKQRIALRFQLASLYRQETAEYIHHRLRIAGGDSSNSIFSLEAVNEIYDYSQGLPRTINILCDNALIMGYSFEARTITPEIIKKVEFEDVYQEMESAKKIDGAEIEIKTIQSEIFPISLTERVPVQLTSASFNNNGNLSLFKKIKKKLLFFRKRAAVK